MNGGAPVVSVVMPVRNAGSTLERAVGSIRGQTFADWELVVVNDASTDGTPALLTRLAREDPRIRIVPGAGQGITAALNAGLASARGEFVARMDADDESHPDRLDEQVKFLRARENRDVGLVSCLVEYGGDRAASAGYALHVDWINSVVTPADIALNRFIESPFAHPSVMFRRELVGQHGGYREGDFPEDYELWLRWLGGGVRMAKVPRVLMRWNDSPRRLSRIDPRYEPDAFFRVKAEWIAREIVGRGLLTPPEPAPPERRGRETPPYRRELFIWGAGRPTRKRTRYLEQHGVKLGGYVDVDAKKFTPAIGGRGAPVFGPDELPPPAEAFVLGYVSSRGARELIRAELRARSYVEGRDFLMCA